MIYEAWFWVGAYAIGMCIAAGCFYEHWKDKPWGSRDGGYSRGGEGFNDNRIAALICFSVIWVPFIIALAGREVYKTIGEYLVKE